MMTTRWGPVVSCSTDPLSKYHFTRSSSSCRVSLAIVWEPQLVVLAKVLVPKSLGAHPLPSAHFFSTKPRTKPGLQKRLITQTGLAKRCGRRALGTSDTVQLQYHAMFTSPQLCCFLESVPLNKCFRFGFRRFERLFYMIVDMKLTHREVQLASIHSFLLALMSHWNSVWIPSGSLWQFHQTIQN